MPEQVEKKLTTTVKETTTVEEIYRPPETKKSFWRIIVDALKLISISLVIFAVLVGLTENYQSLKTKFRNLNKKYIQEDYRAYKSIRYGRNKAHKRRGHLTHRSHAEIAFEYDEHDHYYDDDF